jgi:hypothetical protein
MRSDRVIVPPPCCVRRGGRFAIRVGNRRCNRAWADPASQGVDETVARKKFVVALSLAIDSAYVRCRTDRRSRRSIIPVWNQTTSGSPTTERPCLRSMTSGRMDFACSKPSSKHCSGPASASVWLKLRALRSTGATRRNCSKRYRERRPRPWMSSMRRSTCSAQIGCRFGSPQGLAYCPARKSTHAWPIDPTHWPVGSPPRGSRRLSYPAGVAQSSPTCTSMGKPA